jgi:hypothetical protein
MFIFLEISISINNLFYCRTYIVTCQIYFQNLPTWECRNVGSHIEYGKKGDKIHGGDFTSYNLEFMKLSFFLKLLH